HGIYVGQRKYIKDILQKTNMQEAKGSNFLFPLGLKLKADEREILPDSEKYRTLIRWLLYLNFTRPSLSYSTQHLSQFIQQPRRPHLEATLHMICYLKQYPEQDLFFLINNNLQLQAYCDSDWASCSTTRKSLTGYCVFLS